MYTSPSLSTMMNWVLLLVRMAGGAGDVGQLGVALHQDLVASHHVASTDAELLGVVIAAGDGGQGVLVGAVLAVGVPALGGLHGVLVGGAGHLLQG